VTGDPDLPRPDAASSSHSALTYYGELVRRQWQGCLPDVCRQIRDPGAFFAVLGEVIAQRIDELADYLAGDDPPGEGYPAKVARLTAARDHAKGRVLGEYLLLPPDEGRPVVVDRGHPSWAEVDAEQRERLGDPLSEEGRPTAKGAVSWIEYVASLAALYVCPTAIAVVRRARNIKRVLILNCIPIAWPAALVMACIMPRKAG